MEKKRSKTWIIWVSIAAVLLAAAGVAVAHYWGLKPVIVAEAGEPLPDITRVADDGDRYAESYGTLPVGLHWINVVHKDKRTPALVWVRDTIAPSAEARELTITYGETVTPDKLVRRIRDASIVAVTFSEPFDFDRVGDFPVAIDLRDKSGNRAKVQSKLHIRATADGITLEAGSPVPAADAFLLEGVDAELKTPLTEEMLHHADTYPVRFLLANGQTAETTLTVKDTRPPTGESTFLWVKPGDPFAPEMLVAHAADETTISFAFLEEPDTEKKDVQNVTVRMTDEGGNTTDIVSALAISHVAPVTVEASKEPLPEDVFGDTGEIVLSEPFIPETPGLYSIPVTVNGEPDYALVTAVDTTPPTVEKKADGVLYTLHPTSPDAVFSAIDLSPVTVEWIKEPDWNKVGEQSVRIRAIDRYDNMNMHTDTVTLQADTEPPVLYGVVNRTAYVGESIAYLAEVYAEDLVDGQTVVTVTSEVIPDREGTYQVVYTSTDLSGNTASATCKFKLVKATVSEEEVHLLAQQTLQKIVNDDMVTAEKLKAVFDYVRGNVRYVGTSDKSDWRKEAARGFKTGKGDCFTFYSVTRALLDELHIDYMSVTRKGGRTRHFWVIVNIGTGWYHFDPTIAPHHKHKCFMWTNKQCQVKSYFWRYEKESFPEIATENFDYNAIVEAERSGRLP